MDSHYTDSQAAVSQNQKGATPRKTLFNQIASRTLRPTMLWNVLSAAEMMRHGSSKSHSHSAGVIGRWAKTDFRLLKQALPTFLKYNAGTYTTPLKTEK